MLAVFIWILGCFAALALIWLLMLMPRRNPPAAMQKLTQWRYAHRGYHDDALAAPENSLAAFRRAVQHGFGAELDVHLTKDGRLAVMHDESLKRMCGVDLRLCDLTASDLAEYTLNGTQEQVPFLEQVLPLFERTAPLIIELKTHGSNAGALCQALMQALDSYSGLYCIESFDPRAVFWFRRNRPEIVRGQLSENFTRDGAKLHPLLRFVLHNLLGNFLTRPDFIACNFHDRRDRSISLCRRMYGVQEFSWTVRSKEEQRSAEQAGSVIIFEGFDPSAGSRT